MVLVFFPVTRSVRGDMKIFSIPINFRTRFTGQDRKKNVYRIFFRSKIFPACPPPPLTYKFFYKGIYRKSWNSDLLVSNIVPKSPSTRFSIFQRKFGLILTQILTISLPEWTLYWISSPKKILFFKSTGSPLIFWAFQAAPAWAVPGLLSYCQTKWME